MSVQALLAELAGHGVQLWIEDDRLRYRAPRGVLTPALQAQLAAAKVEILALLSGQSLSPADQRLPKVAPSLAERYLPFPLNDIQQAYWIGRNQSFELGGVGSHVYWEFENSGLDLARLEQAWQQLIVRHEMLRAIMLPDGQQQILPETAPYHFATLDLRGQDETAAQLALAAVRDQLSHQVFSPERWPLFDIRASLLDGGRIRLHVSVDILVADAWSLFLIFQEWWQWYQNPEAQLAALELSFRDYVLAEAAFHQSETYQRSLAYWLARLPTLPPGPELPLASSPGAGAIRSQFVRRTRRIEAESWQCIKRRASEAGLTPSGVLLAAFAEILAAWSKNPRFTLNIPLFNRLPLHPQVNEIVGDFTSLILLEVDTSRPESFTDRAMRLRDQLAKDLEHRYVSGVRVLRELFQTQKGARTVMPVIFTSTIRQDRVSAEALPMSWLGDIVYGVSQVPQVWLDHQVFEDAGALVFNWDAVEALFPDGLLDTMLAAYRHLLQRLGDEDLAWTEVARSLIPETQIRQRRAVNATETVLPVDRLHRLVDAQARQRPDQAAVIGPDKTLTYGALAYHARQLGHRLQQLGARPDMLVAVTMGKGWEQVVAVLGILESGAAYLPIDANLPQERLWYLIENGNVNLVLTQSWLDDALAWPKNVRRICVDTLVGENESPATARQPWPQSAGTAGEDGAGGLANGLVGTVSALSNLAYVIYTSGSTGLPKGVMIDHQGAANTILDVNQRFGVGPGDRVLALSSLSFDLSVYDIFGLLAAGGTIVMPRSAATPDPAHWVDLLRREQVTIWNSVPALMEMTVEYLMGRGERLPASLRLVMLSGDWIPVTLPDQLRAISQQEEASAPGNRQPLSLISLGGATEASIWSILYPIQEVASDWKSIPYGRPMANQRFHVLDQAFEHRPVWVPGQLYIGGVGLAKGYWQNEAKSQASFIHHPQTGERLYRTGDLGCYLPDGNIEFLGREDFQVKIQGYRIELGEIEAVLHQHPAVRAAVVTAVGQRQGSKQLVAYIVPTAEAVTAWSHDSTLAEFKRELRDFLQGKLPAYMVPTTFLILEALPLTANGKVDRQALPLPEALLLELETDYVAARTPVEEALTQIFGQVLRTERIGVYGNFYELGLDSLQAVRVNALIREMFQIELPLRTILVKSTIADLGQRIEEIIAAEIDSLTEEEALAQLQALSLDRSGES